MTQHNQHRRMPEESEDVNLLAYIKGLFEAQNKILDRQGEKLDKTAEAVVKQGETLAHLAKQMDVLSQSHAELVKDLPDAFLPRKEFQAMNIDTRLAMAEKDIAETKLAAQSDIAQHRFTLDGRTISTLLTALFALVSILVTLYFHYAH